MSRLTADEIRGVWAGVTLSWDEEYRFDEAMYATNIQRTIDARVHGIYTTGSTGEFYALEYPEFCRMVDIQAELCGAAGMPLQIGCCSDSTAKTLRLLEYATSKPQVGAAQVVLPYWMELTDREMLQFFRDLTSACPDLPLVHYNVPRAKKFLTTGDYQRILEVAPQLVGVKFTFAGSHFGALQDALLKLPQISFFVGEDLLVSAMMLGAQGCYSSLIFTNPNFMQQLYAHAAAREWEAALEMQEEMARFLGEISEFVEGKEAGTIDPVFDKGLAVAAGAVLGSARTRPPYIGWSDEMVSATREWLRANHPEFLFPT